MRILITEDDFASRRVLQLILHPYGICEVATNGREALEAFQAAIDEGIPYHLVCLDIMMPEMDGQDVLKEIRRIEREIKVESTKVVMISALDDFENIKRAFTEQCEAYLVKPVSREKLLDVLLKVGLLK